MTARLYICLLLAAASTLAQPNTVRIGVLGLFEPSELTLRASNAGPLRLSAGGTVEAQRTAKLVANRDRIIVNIDGHTIDSDQLTTEGAFELAVPGKLARQYHGVLAITARGGKLQAVVAMDIETAVAAAVSGESDLNGPEQALIAQAVASRSYLTTRPRHQTFDFCDTTHCQYLTDAASEKARRAAAASQGVVLWFDGKVMQALFTRSCDGRTRTPQEVGLVDHPEYQSVACPICGREPQSWTRKHSLADVSALIGQHTETARLNVVRRLGWDAMPSNAYSVDVDGDTAVFTGAGEGHGIGLCQRGAVGLARQGASWRDILHHYFPAAVIR